MCCNDPRHWKRPFTMMASRVQRASHSSMLKATENSRSHQEERKPPPLGVMPHVAFHGGPGPVVGAPTGLCTAALGRPLQPAWPRDSPAALPFPWGGPTGGDVGWGGQGCWCCSGRHRTSLQGAQPWGPPPFAITVEEKSGARLSFQRGHQSGPTTGQ